MAPTLNTHTIHACLAVQLKPKLATERQPVTPSCSIYNLLVPWSAKCQAVVTSHKSQGAIFSQEATSSGLGEIISLKQNSAVVKFESDAAAAAAAAAAASVCHNQYSDLAEIPLHLLRSPLRVHGGFARGFSHLFNPSSATAASSFSSSNVGLVGAIMHVVTRIAKLDNDGDATRCSSSSSSVLSRGLVLTGHSSGGAFAILAGNTASVADDDDD
jgi:hypothetical protein